MRGEADPSEESCKRFIGQQADKRAKREGDGTEAEGDPPFTRSDVCNLERGTADKHNQNLDDNFCRTTRIVSQTKTWMRREAYRSK